MNSYEYLLQDINTIKGIGTKTSKLFKKKNINTMFDLLWSLPRSSIDRTNLIKINELQVGKIQTITVNVIKYNFPRIRNLPNKVFCEDDTGKIECIFFNSYEGYIKKILPINSTVTISGKTGYYKKKYQITNPTYISTNTDSVKKNFSNYSLTEGLTEKKYNTIIKEVLKNIPDLKEWLSDEILKKFNFISWKKISNKYLTIFFKSLSGKSNKYLNISFVAQKKLGNAVKRNKIKRRLKKITYKNYEKKTIFF